MRRRILVSILLVVAATVLALGVPLGIVSWRLVSDHLQSDLQGRLESAATYLTEQDSDGQPINLKQLMVAVPEGGVLDVIDASGRKNSIGDVGLTDRYTATVSLPGGRTIRLSVPMERLRTEHREAMLLVAAAVLLSLLVGTTIALVLARRLSQPLRDVAGRAALLGEGDFRQFDRRYGIAELDRVAEVLDSSAFDISVLIARERDLTGNISHQLRTRLTGLRLGLEEVSLLGDAASAQEVQSALDQTDELVAVLDEMLAAARSRRAAGASELNLTDVLAEIETEWGRTLTAAGRELVVGRAPTATVQATRLRLREALNVLLDNALTHGSGRVEVSARAGERTVVIEVSDQGTGVPEALVGHIFDRGVSTASSNGIGLGLARAFIEADGGRLELRRPAPPVFGVFLAVAAAARTTELTLEDPQHPG